MKKHLTEAEIKKLFTEPHSLRRTIDKTLKVKYNYSYKTAEEKLLFFERWIEKCNRIISNPTLDNFL
jgi:hypothetical protein